VCMECLPDIKLSKFTGECVVNCIAPEIVDPEDARFCEIPCLDNCKLMDRNIQDSNFLGRVCDTTTHCIECDARPPNVAPEDYFRLS
jgi:hypothetical protein